MLLHWHIMWSPSGLSELVYTTEDHWLNLLSRCVVTRIVTVKWYYMMQHLSEEYTYTRQHEDGDGQQQKVSPGSTSRSSSRMLPSELQREMVEVCLDMLARYTFASVFSQPARWGANLNINEWSKYWDCITKGHWLLCSNTVCRGNSGSCVMN